VVLLDHPERFSAVGTGPTAGRVVNPNSTVLSAAAFRHVVPLSGGIEGVQKDAK